MLKTVKSDNGGTPTMVDAKQVFLAVSDAEADMRQVECLATLIFDVLAERGPLGDVQRDGLTYLAGDLCNIGTRLKQQCDALYAAAGISSGGAGQ